MKKFLFCFLFLFCITSLAGCKGNTISSSTTVVVDEVDVVFNYLYDKPSETVHVNKGEKAEKPDDPSRDGYTFGGWFTTENCAENTKFSFDTVITSNIVLYAKWTEDIVEVNVVLNYQYDKPSTTIKVVKGGKIEKPSDPSRDGYIFGGWFTAKNCEPTTAFSFNTIINANIEIFAKWTLVQVEAQITEIKIQTMPTKTTYIEGEVFNPTGMVVIGIYEDETEKAITDYTYMANFELTMGLTLFPISYGELEAYVDIIVIEKTILDVSIGSLPTKTSYLSYEVFNPSGLILAVSYDNGKTENIDSGYTFLREVLSNCPTEVTVKYQGFDIVIPVQVDKVIAYGIPSAKAPAYVDARGIYDQLELTASLGNIEGTTVFGDISVVASSERAMQYEKVNTGDPSHKYEYLGHVYEGLIKFAGASTPKGRYLIIDPTEDGTLHFWSSSSALASLCLYNTYTEASTDEDIVDIIPLTGQVLEYTIPVYAGEKFYITTSANAFIRGMALIYTPTYVEVEEFNIDTTDVIKEYAVGQSLNVEGLKASVTLKNNETYDLTKDEYTVETVDLSSSGVKTIRVLYQNELVKTFDIEVFDITSLVVESLPTKNVYLVGETLDTAGMIIMASTGRIQYEINDFEISHTGALALGDVITITWKGLSVVLEVEIKENPIESISIQTMPNKTIYKSEEVFDPTGLEITIHYTSGETSVTTAITFEQDPLADDATFVTVYYGVFTVNVPITMQIVDYFVADYTTYIDAKTIVTEGQIEHASSIAGDIMVGDVQIYAKSIFQYEKIDTVNEIGGHQYTGIFKAGGVTKEDRYIKIIPKQGATFMVWAAVSSGSTQTIYLVDKLTAPNLEDNTTYIDYITLNGSTYVQKIFNLEANQEYYLWFTGQTLMKGLYLSYGKVRSEIESLSLDTSLVKKEFYLNDSFDSENLIVKANCSNKEEYPLEDYIISTPDMTTAGIKTIEIKYGKVSIATYTIEVVERVAQLTDVSIKTNPNKIEYLVGEVFDATGLILTLTYSDESTLDITEGYEIENLEALTIEHTYMTILYQGYEVKITIQVLAKDMYEIPASSSLISALDIATEAGLAGNGNFTSTVTIKEFTFVYGSQAMQIGNYDTTYTYDGYTFNSLFKLGGASTKTGRYISLNLTRKGTLIFYAAGLSGAQPTISILKDIDGESIHDLYIEGTYAKTEYVLEAGNYILYADLNTQFRGFVIEYEEVSTVVDSLSLNIDNVKVDYAVDEVLDLSGLEVYVLCGNETFLLQETEYTILSNIDMSTPGTKEIIIQYQNYTSTKLNINVLNLT